MVSTTVQSVLLTALLCLLGGHKISGEPREHYMQRRQDILQRSRTLGTGGTITLDPRERIVNDILMDLKLKELYHYKAYNEGQHFPPAKHFMNAKGDIEKSEVFQILKMMPKGAALHVHDYAMVELSWIVSNLTYHPQCFMCIQTDGSLNLAYYEEPPSTGECKWRSVNAARQSAESLDRFDQWLYQQLSFEEPENFTSQRSIWDRFRQLYGPLNNLVHSEIGFAATYTRAMEELHKDNVQYLELRREIGKVSRSNGQSLGSEWQANSIIEASYSFVQQHQDFMGVKIIPIFHRELDKTALRSSLSEIRAIRRKFPNLVVGFDVANHEDYGHDLLYFIDELLEPSQEGEDLPFILHAGETNWNGLSVNENLIDAILLNSTRIGHGLAASKNPILFDYIKRNNIAIEVNPISNQVLQYVQDLRNHPAATYMALGLPVVISSDIPTFWEVTGLSYDFYEAFMGFTGGWGDLATLKALALDSIRYSSLNGDERIKILDIWNKKWDEFLDAVMSEYDCAFCMESP